MRRTQPFRLTLWRLGSLILAWYALVLQTWFAGPLALEHAQTDPLGQAIICSQATDAAPGTGNLPGAPLHADCTCLAHCAGNLLTGIVPAGVASAGAPHWSEEPAVFRPSQSALPIWRAGTPVRGPPAAIVQNV